MDKRLLTSLVIGALGVIFMTADTVCAEDYYPSTTTQKTVTTTTVTTITTLPVQPQVDYNQKVQEIGYKLLKASGYQSSVKFNYVESETVNANATDISKAINVYGGLAKKMGSDEELAAVMAHEIGHILNEHSSSGSLRNYGMNLAATYTKAKIGNKYASTGIDFANSTAKNKFTRVDEYEADRAACDIMVKAGYNPLALISALQSIGDKYYDFFSDHPSTEKRNINIYDYVSAAYPEYIAKGYNTQAYKFAMIDIETALAKRQANPEEQAKALAKQREMQQKRVELTQKTETGSRGWNNTYNVVNTGLKIISAINNAD